MEIQSWFRENVSGTAVKATTIRIGGGEGNGQQEFNKNSAFGTVATINGTTITITSKAIQNGDSTSSATATTYTVDASKATVTKDGASSSVSAIAVGDTIIVQGTVSGTAIAATSIQDGKGQTEPAIKGTGEPVVSGTITAVNGTNLTITNKSNVTYTIDASNATITKGNTASTISNVATGDTVIVQGTFSGNSVVATSVVDHGTASASAQTETSHQGGNLFGNIFSSVEHFFKLFGF